MEDNRNKIMDNLHIVLWLIKDLLWSMDNRLGVLLIIPAVIVSVYILVKQFNNRSCIFHNLAVCFWIVANSIWMCCDLYRLNYMGVVYFLFGVGLGILLYFYFGEIIKRFWKSKK